MKTDCDPYHPFNPRLTIGSKNIWKSNLVYGSAKLNSKRFDKAGAKILLARINKLNAVTLVLERIWEAEILPSSVFALVLISG